MSNADLIAKARKEVASLGIMRIGNPATINSLADALESAEAKLAALLSDEAVERAAYAMYLDRPLELDQEGGDDWAILPDEWKYEWSEGARIAIRAALGEDA